MPASLGELIDDPALRADAGAEAMVAASLARIAAVEPALNAFISVRGDLALAEAREIDARRARGDDLGPLAGLPVAVKDNIDVTGTPATAGSLIRADYIPEADAEVVRRLRGAGAVVVGKTALHELAYGVTSINHHYGPVRNPWDTSRIPGGSSGGSGAALGADACLLALGTDTGGSVRIPAALNGVTGLRPTHGSVSSRGSLPVSASLDTIGPMARSARDVAALHAVISAFDPADAWAVDGPIRNPLSKLDAGIEGVRIARLGGFFAERVDPAVDRAVGDAADVLGRLGAELVELELPGGAKATANAGELIRAEALSIHLDDLNATPDSFGPDVRERLELGREVSGVDVARALAEMRAWRALLLRQFGNVDLLLTPTTIEAAPEIAGSNMLETTARLTRFTYPWSLAGLPAISVPCGHDAAGLPVGMQLIAAPWRDDTLLTAAVAYQGGTDWHTRRPELNGKSEHGGANA